MITLKEAELAIGEPAKDWAGRCFEIASRLVDEGAAPGIAVYGHWIGPISPKSYFAKRRGFGFVQHGWIAYGGAYIIDPTRWVFEARAPYIYYGLADHYDEGGNRLRMAMAPPRPKTIAVDEKVYDYGPHLDDEGAKAYLRRMFPRNPPGKLGRAQLFWLGNRAPQTLDGHAKAIFAMFKRMGNSEIIPIDNRRMVETGRVK